MTHKNFSFWFCTLLSGIVIGIASQRLPEAHASMRPHPQSFYYADQNSLARQSLASFQIHESSYAYAKGASPYVKKVRK